MDDLECNACWLEQAGEAVLLLVFDLVYVTKELTADIRSALAERLALNASQILVAATHTHSGPTVLRSLADRFDPNVPTPDREELDRFIVAAVDAAIVAYESRRLATIHFALESIEGIGGNRHDPRGPSNAMVPVLSFRAAEDERLLGLLLICDVHPTVLHADSRLVSGDFPGQARQLLRERHGNSLGVLHFCGASGDQSPRHFIAGNTVNEARRIGGLLAGGVDRALARSIPVDLDGINSASVDVDLPLRELPDMSTARAAVDRAAASLDRVKVTSNIERAEVRTVECDWLGAKATLALARLRDAGEIDAALSECQPAEIQAIKVGPIVFVAWPGEWFHAYGQTVRDRHRDAYVITLANGELEGYIVTAEAIRDRRYEAGSALFDGPVSAELVITATDALIKQLRAGA